jgi:hypothetical protein
VALFREAEFEPTVLLERPVELFLDARQAALLVPVLV